VASQLQESSRLVKEVALAMVQALLQAVEGVKAAAGELLPAGPTPQQVVQNVRLQMGSSLTNAARRLELLVPLQVRVRGCLPASSSSSSRLRLQTCGGPRQTAL
jgi:hypothetical protein